MNEEIRVHVIDRGRKYFSMRYRDPLTGKQIERSTEKERRKDAEKAAAVWEAELREGRYKPPSKTLWSEFRQRYEDEVVVGLADRTFEKVSSTFNLIEEFVSPEKLAQLTAERISRFQAELRKRGRSENTIKSHLAHLLSALRWAKRVGLLVEVPEVQMPRRARLGKQMKGRPVTGEEFERILDKVPEGLIAAGRDRARKPEKPTRRKNKPKPLRVPSADVVESWRHLLRGLWWSGLRLAEAMELYWDRDDKLCVDLSGRYPMMRIPAELEKGHKDRLLPIAPEFAEFLLATSQSERAGPVFHPLPMRANASRLTAHRVSVVISAIGKAAGVKVQTDPCSDHVKYASAHDLRRSFGERWATRVMPQVLKELMRHESIETTMRYYVGVNAQRTADAVWKAFATVDLGDTLGDRAADSSSAHKKAPSQPDAATGLTEWGRRDLNPQPTDYESAALTD